MEEENICGVIIGAILGVAYLVLIFGVWKGLKLLSK